ncbi:MAG: hypothetical protein SAK29_12570 [Scytonema sp. PMC 1069.18]|nr:hypothetical protein [Scytonema sp. PMC 1069.18]MEC4883120.1 hypothetical protein [Scytonema sp. PMC 1070.18]
MLAQFQSKYPQGSLSAELVQIYHGKYIVRAIIQVEGVTRATGMAASETLEDAEDKARSRALMVLGITESSQESRVISPEPTKQLQPNPSFTATNRLKESADFVAFNTSSPEQAKPVSPQVPLVTAQSETKNEVKNEDIGDHGTPSFGDRIPKTHKQETQFDFPTSDKGDRFATMNKQESLFETANQDIVDGATPPLSYRTQDANGDRIPTTPKPETQFQPPISDQGDRFATTNHSEAPLENLEMMSGSKAENPSFAENSKSNVTPFPSRTGTSQENAANQSATTAKRKKKNEPVDQSDDIAKIGIEMQRLGWTTDQGRDYLINTYGKRSRHLLTPEELKSFLLHLESQPTPIDPLAGF